MEHDEIGYWTEIKLDIVREYASAYSRILSAQKRPPLDHIYVDAFAGSGVHLSKRTGEFIKGSPLNALLVEPPFKSYHLIDLDGAKTDSLRELTGNQADVHIYHGDCNQILLEKVFPLCQFKDYRRALCLLDPYGLHLNWDVLLAAGHSKSIEVFLNFPVLDMNRNVLWKNPEGVSDSQKERINSFWGDGTWYSAAYRTEGNLFGFEEKTDNACVVQAFRKRLKDVAGFASVPEPIPMRNSKGAVVYYLFFASPKPVAASIVKDIFNKYREKGKL